MPLLAVHEPDRLGKEVEKVQDLEDEKTQVVELNGFRDIEKAQYHKETY